MCGDFPRFEELYSTDDRRHVAYQSALVEALGYCRWTRLREIAEFAERMGYRRVGIGHCPDMAREAVLTALYLRDRMLEARLPPEKSECDPLDQARLFASQETELNVVGGMCVGHEAIFVRASQAPVTVLVARDERFCHNPAAALYTADSYSHSRLYGRENRSERIPFQGWDLETLSEAAESLEPARHEKWCRLEETMEFAHRLGITHVGVSFCVGFRNEARLLTRVLEANGFQVSSACCKTGSIPKEELGILDSQKVRPNQPEMICNPLAQAELLNRAAVQLVLVLGQCVGHDSATLANVQAPAICIVAKDRVLAHNTVAALYELEG
ncbi:MAG: DUF1847 domain-containing protein [Gemmatimonadota bacterium]|nr:MAG: DUF1847 domain-containing protein [Gemmatimonadota bacterium]